MSVTKQPCRPNGPIVVLLLLSLVLAGNDDAASSFESVQSISISRKNPIKKSCAISTRFLHCMFAMNRVCVEETKQRANCVVDGTGWKIGVNTNQQSSDFIGLPPLLFRVLLLPGPRYPTLEFRFSDRRSSRRLFPHPGPFGPPPR